MNNRKFKYTGLICSLFMVSAITLTGCSMRKHEKIILDTQTGSTQESGLEESAETEGVEVQSGEELSENEGAALHITLDTEAETQEAVAVADTSPLNSTLTTDNGFTDTDDTVYITQNLVNVRSDCSTDSKIVVQLNTGDSIKRTGYKEGWSRVMYKENVCYVSSDFVTTAAPEEESVSGVRALSKETSPEGEQTAATVSNGRIIAIDAGHQAKGDSTKEPIGPGSSTMKARMASGAEGISSGIPEYKLTLAVSQKLKRILEERGYKVVMTRETNDVNISNAERAKLANESGASAFVRIHANSHDNSTVSGTLTMCQTSKSPYNGEQHSKSYALSRQIADHVSTVTGFKNRGVQETDTMSGINWSTIPVSIVEMGFLSNPEEDQKMAQEEYQEIIAAGIADGIDAYFAQ